MAAKAKILIVEDNHEVRRLYAIGLTRHGYEVKLASNGAEALDRIDKERPDLILLDLMMPIMNGWEMVEKISPAGSPPRIPVIVVSGHLSSNPSEPHPSIAAWVAKPVTIEELVEQIEQQLTTGKRKN